MIAVFQKQAERRYSITIIRDDGIEMTMGQGPGFSEYLPHDLQHFIVEKALGLRNGVFGQVAIGGSAGTFHAHKLSGSKREQSRQRRAAKRKGRALMQSGRDDSERSERATIICLHYWMSRSSEPALQREAQEIAAYAESTLNGLDSTERDSYTPEVLETVRAEMARLSAEWRRAGRVAVEWHLRR